MPLNYDPDIPDDVIVAPTRLRRVAKLLRNMASGVITEIEGEEKINQYKQLLFTAAKGVDEAAALFPDDVVPVPVPQPEIKTVYPWWVWLLLGGASIVVPFFIWIAYMRYIMGERIGFIT